MRQTMTPWIYRRWPMYLRRTGLDCGSPCAPASGGFGHSSNVVQWWRAANGLCEQPHDLMDAAPSQWLLWRRGVKTLFRSLDAFEAMILDAARAGASFGHLCEQVARQVDESAVAIRAATFLRGWIAEELIAGYSLRTDTE
jgi:hypothetical protein